MKTIADTMVARKAQFQASMAASYKERGLEDFITVPFVLTGEAKERREKSEAELASKTASDAPFWQPAKDLFDKWFKKDEEGSKKADDKASSEAAKEEQSAEVSTEAEASNDETSNEAAVEEDAASAPEASDLESVSTTVNTKDAFEAGMKQLVLDELSLRDLKGSEKVADRVAEIRRVDENGMLQEIFKITAGTQIHHQRFEDGVLKEEHEISFAALMEERFQKQEVDIEKVAKKVAEEQPGVESNAMADALLNAKRGNHRRNNRRNHSHQQS